MLYDSQKSRGHRSNIYTLGMILYRVYLREYTWREKDCELLSHRGWGVLPYDCTNNILLEVVYFLPLMNGYAWQALTC